MKDLVYWECGSCGKVHSSNPEKRHSMDWCPCGQSAVDAEEFYSRMLGSVKIISKEEYEEIKQNTSE